MEFRSYMVLVALLNLAPSLLLALGKVASISDARAVAAASCPSGGKDADKFDCFPGHNATEAECLDRGCCWDPIPNQNTSGPHNEEYPDSRYPIHVGVPACYYPSPYPSYSYVSIVPTNYGYEARLARDSTPSPFPKDVANVKINVYFETKTRLRVKISDADSSRYEVPFPEVPVAGKAANDTDYEFAFNDKVGFSVSRRDTGEVLFNSSVGSFIFSDQYIQLSALLSTDYLYGLGQHNDDFRRSFDWQLIPLFASLLYPDYGSHPFYLALEESRNSHGVFLFNSNGMDVLLQPTPAISYRVIGGILDFYFFLGPTPNDVIRQYTEVIGTSSMPPYWSLGFHLCRYNYGSLNATRETWLRNKDAGIPFDVQWNDIDYMDVYKIFTYDQVQYAGLPEFVEELHDNHMRYVTIIDAGISVETPGTYPTYDEGVQMDVFVKNISGGYANGQVWPQLAVFTDFTHPNAYSFWKTQYQRMHDLFAYDGAWIDMNEPTTFSAGSINGVCPNTTYDYPPYVPDVEYNQLFGASICMSSQHAAGVHYNLHNLYGLLNTVNTNRAIKDVLHKRPFVLSRSTFPGQGHYGAHWTGDIYSSWHDLAQSIPGIMNFNMYGISMVGADICGFRRNTTLELCQRWTALGAFYPFTRNHNDYNSIAQDPVALGPEMVDVARKSLTLRYTLLPFFYTQFYRSHVYGEPVIRPLFFEFPEDESTYLIQDQFLWSGHLMVLPVIAENTTTINPYFPKGVWYLYPNTSVVQSPGGNFELPAPRDAIWLAIRGGSTLPTQESSQTTDDSRKNRFGLLAALDEDGASSGELFWDDGHTIDTIENDQYTLISFAAGPNSLNSTVVKYNYEGDVPMVLGSVTVFGVAAQPASVEVNQEPIQSFSYSNQVLKLEELSVSLLEPFVVVWH